MTNLSTNQIGAATVTAEEMESQGVAHKRMVSDDMSVVSGVIGDDASERDRRYLEDAVRSIERMRVANLSPVHEWVRSQREEDVVSVGAAADRPGSSSSSGGAACAEDVGEQIEDAHDYAVRVQRFIASKASAEYMHGRVPMVAPFRDEAVLPSLRYGRMGSIAVTTLEDGGGVYERLARGERIVAQLIAATGIGKTTKFPAMIAAKSAVRVLQLEPNQHLADAAKRAQAGTGLTTRVWSRIRKPQVVTMSYAEFVGRMLGNDGTRLLSQTDVLYMDETHVPRADIEATKAIVATRAPATLSVLSVSATAVGEDDAQALSGAREVVHTSKSFMELLESGKFTSGAYCRDRTLLIVPDDIMVSKVADKLATERFLVRTLDSASSSGDVMRAQEFFDNPDSLVNRYLVVTSEYGTGYNFAAEMVVTAGLRAVYDLSEDRLSLTTRYVRIDKNEMKQHCGRVGRGMANKAVAIVCGTIEEFPDEPYKDSEYYLRLYVSLVGARITPLPELIKTVTPLLPFGVSERMARALLATQLPISIAIRYFASDGKVPYKWAKALEVFSDDGQMFELSGEKEPLGVDLWKEEIVGGYYGSQPINDALSVRVPLSADGHMQVVVQALSLMAMGLMKVERWSPPVDTNDLSGEDEEVTAKPSQMRFKPRLVEGVKVRSRVLRIQPAYAYDAPFLQTNERGALEEPVPTAYLEALAALDTDTSLENFNVRCNLHHEIDERGVERVNIQQTTNHGLTPIEVNSPGGTPVASFRRSVWEQLADGKALTDRDALSFFHAVRANVAGFAESDAFSGWTPVWDGVLLTLADPANVVHIKRNKLHERASTLLLKLVERYRRAVFTVSKNSYLASGFLESLLTTRRSYQELFERQSRKGRAAIVQSQKFYLRIYDIRELLIRVVEEWEEEKLFVPLVVTSLQSMLPVFGRVGNPIFDKPSRSRRFLLPKSFGFT